MYQTLYKVTPIDSLLRVGPFHTQSNQQNNCFNGHPTECTFTNKSAGLQLHFTPLQRYILHFWCVCGRTEGGMRDLQTVIGVHCIIVAVLRGGV